MSKVPTLPNSRTAVRQDRRGILKTGATLAGTAALLSAIKAVTPAGAWAAGTDGIEKPKLNLGFSLFCRCCRGQSAGSPNQSGAVSAGFRCRG